MTPVYSVTGGAYVKRKARSNQNRTGATTRKSKRKVSLQRCYTQYFFPARLAVDENDNVSLEQPSPFKTVPSVVTYGVGESPMLGYVNA